MILLNWLLVGEKIKKIQDYKLPINITEDKYLGQKFQSSGSEDINNKNLNSLYYPNYNHSSKSGLEKFLDRQK